MDAFTYPDNPHVRRHGPQGYAVLESFSPWLRDEFSFRCVYCLLREQWALAAGVFGIDHFLPVASHPEKNLQYDNLLYCCATCNGGKGKRHVPDPEKILLADDVKVREDGTVEARTAAARRLIRILGINDPEYVEFRMLWLQVVALAQQHDPKLFEKLMGFPDGLPDLARLRPPAGNSRPEGVNQSYFAQRQQGTLPPTY